MTLMKQSIQSTNNGKDALVCLWNTGFLNPHNVATKRSAMMPVQDLTHWPKLHCGAVMNLNGGKFLSQTCNSSVFWEPTSFVGRKQLLSCKLHQDTVFYFLNFIPFCPLSFYRTWQGKISVNSTESQSLWRINNMTGWNWLSRSYWPERMLFCPVNAVFSILSTKKYCSTITTRRLTALGVLKYIVLGLWRSLLTPSACLPSNLISTSSKC